MTHREQTRQVRVGQVVIGGGAPVAIQSMTSTPTHDVGRTVDQIRRLAAAGCDLVRVAVPERSDTEALPEILSESPLPIIADVHYHYQRALEAVRAGVHKIRLNPGNMRDRDKVNQVLAACLDDARIVERLGEKGVREAFDLRRLLRNVPAILRRALR